MTRQPTDAVERYGLRLRYDTIADLKRQGILDRQALKAMTARNRNLLFGWGRGTEALFLASLAGDQDRTV